MSIEFKHQLSYSVFYAFLLLLVLQGFLIQGLRLASRSQRTRCTICICWKTFFISISDVIYHHKQQMKFTHHLWYFHMLTTMAFIALIPYTRALHIVTASLNLFTKRLEPTVRLSKMDFENADAEYFGARDIKDFTWKDLLSFDSCTECRRCTDICPANAVGKPLDPREVILNCAIACKLKNNFMKVAQSHTMKFGHAQIVAHV